MHQKLCKEKDGGVFSIFLASRSFLCRICFSMYYRAHVISRTFPDHQKLKSAAHLRLLPSLIHISFIMFILIHFIPVYFPFVLQTPWKWSISYSEFSTYIELKSRHTVYNFEWLNKCTYTKFEFKHFVARKIIQIIQRKQKDGSTIFNYHTGGRATQGLSRDELVHLTVHFSMRTLLDNF